MLNPLLEYPISGYIVSNFEINTFYISPKHMFNRYLFFFLTFFVPALCNAQDLGRCARGDISIVEKFKACKAIVSDSQYTKNQQARAAIVAGLLNQINNGSANESIGLFLLAADKGDLDGYALIGDIYREGYQGIEKDFGKALDYYYRDTSHSDIKANGLALLYLHGQGVDQNSSKAIVLTKMAFTLNKSSRMTDRICNIYSEDKYGVKDIVKAHMWCSISVKTEVYPELKAFYEDKRLKLASSLSDAQIKQSDELLKKCVSSLHSSDCNTPVIIN